MLLLKLIPVIVGFELSDWLFSGLGLGLFVCLLVLKQELYVCLFERYIVFVFGSSESMCWRSTTVCYSGSLVFVI